MIVANGPLYFGCVGTAGHYLVDQNLQSIHTRASGIAWMEDLDGLLPPRGDRETEGEACLHVIHDWTLLAFWDRSVDSRPNSNSVFFLPGIHTGEWALEVARKAFPSIFASFTFEIRLRPSGLAEVLRRFVKGA